MRKRALFVTLCLALGLLACPAGAAEAQDWAVVWLAPELEAAGPMSEGLLEVHDREEGGLGYVDKTGQLVIPADFLCPNAVFPFSDGLAAVGKPDPATGEAKWGFIDHKGETAIPFIYDDVMGFSEGLACVGVERTERFGIDYSYIDTTGAEVIPANDAYDVAYSFHDGMALVRNWQDEDLWGYIDKTGKLVVPCVLDDARDFSEGLAAVGQYEDEKGLKVGYVNTDGSWEMYTYYADLGCFSEGLAAVHGYTASGESVCFYVDRKGQTSPALDYDRAQEFHEGRARVTKLGNEEGQAKMGFIDRAGNTAVPCVYDDARDFSEGLAAVCRREGETEKWGFVDRYGREVVPLSFDGADSFFEGVAVVRQGDRYGLLTLRRTAYARTQTVAVDGKAVPLEMYALQDGQSGETNYVKVRDVAQVLNGTAAQFAVEWNGGVDLTPGQAYVPNGSELTTPYSGDRTYQSATALTQVNGAVADLDAIVLHDDQGGGYTYYKLRDLGKALGFQVGWAQDRGVYIETDKPYQE